MKRTDFQAIYVMWLREMKRFVRAKSRVIAMIVQPLFFLFIFGFGLAGAAFPGMQGKYVFFLAPGIITMAIMFSSMFTGVSVLWDKQFGFLQEVLVAPVSRLAIIIGRTFGGATTALFQGFIILGIAVGLGVTISNPLLFLMTIVMMILISFTAVGFGLIVASKMEDFHGFQLIMNLLILPLFFLSSAFFPISDALPSWLKTVSYANPLLYMVDGMRGALTGVNNLFPPLVDLGIISVICFIIMGLGTYFFSKTES